MNKKSLIILCLIFVVLIGLVFVKRNMTPRVPTAEEISDIIAPSIHMDHLSQIVLKLGDSAGEEGKSQYVSLAKEGGRWLVKTQYDVRASETMIAPVLERLDRLKGELRSDREGLLADYGIEDGQGLHVQLRGDGAEDIHIVVGTQKAGYQNNFVRLAGSNAVYVVGENLLGTLGVRGEGEEIKLDTDRWSDKRITDLDADRVTGITVVSAVNGTDTTVLDLKKRDSDGKKQWQSEVPYAFGLSASKIRSMLEAFNGTYAREIVAPEAAEVFDAPDWSATFTMENAEQVKLVRGAKDEEQKNYYAKIDGAGYFYLIPVSTFDNRETQQGDIFAPNPLKVEESTVAAIDVQDIDAKKKFYAAKNVSTKPAETAADDGPSAGTEETVSWQQADGETIDTAKVSGIINKVKDINLEAVPKPVVVPKAALIVKITTDDGLIKEYAISLDMKFDNGKECHLLTQSGDEQPYCVSKAQVTALKESLP